MMNPKTKTKMIGIDLGTTNTCVACYENGSVRILENEEGDRTTPSHVYVTEKNEIIVGSSAKDMVNRKDEYGIYDIRRLLGQKFDDPQLQKNLKYFPFTIENVKNNPVVKIKRSNDHFTATPIELCTAILKKIKKDAEAKLGETVTQAVITVPSYFNNSQREAMILAAEKAGLAVLKLLNETTAAALSYYLRHEKQENYLLVYDLGGGTFDVAILKRSGSNIDVIGADGNTHLGGNDFDNLIIDYVTNQLIGKYKFDSKLDLRCVTKLRNHCEKAKKLLSTEEEIGILPKGFSRQHPTLEVKLTRAQFEEMANKLFQTTIDILDGCLKNCKIAKTDIKEVILSGGSTRIPKIQKMVSEYFNGKTLNKIVNPDECVAEGAALQAATFSTNKNQKVETFKITDVTPLSLGTSILGDLMSVFIKRNTPIPANATRVFLNHSNKQKTIIFKIYEGERTNVKKNRFLNRVTITDLTPAPPGQCVIFVTMSIDVNGILQIRVKEKFHDNVKEGIVSYTRGDRSDKEVQNALKDAEENRIEDERFVTFAKLKNFVVIYCEAAKCNFENKGLKTVHYDLFNLCVKTKRVANKMKLQNEDKLKKLKDNIIKACDSVVNQYNFEFMPTKLQCED